jgi:histone H3/H4
LADIAVTGVDRILRKAGAERVNIKASEKLRGIIEELTMEIGKEAINLSHYAGRKTLRAEDIALAYRSWKNQERKFLPLNTSNARKETYSRLYRFVRKLRVKQE